MSDNAAAIVTIGTELTEGLRVDTNSAEIAAVAAAHGFHVQELVSLPDDPTAVAAAFARLIDRYALVVSTGGLGPTHDDITRDATARALGIGLVRDARLVALLQPAVARHADAQAAAQVLVQAEVFEGCEIIDPATGTAPGLVIPTALGLLALLPGPPTEMRPMLFKLMERFSSQRAVTRELGVTGLTESDVQVLAQRALTGWPAVGLTVLARPGDVRVVLIDEGAGAEGLHTAAQSVAEALTDHCYSTSGESLPEALVSAATAANRTFALAESCTGGLAAALVTNVPGASTCLLGGVVAYSNHAKTALLGVEPQLIASHGAVSEPVARAMAHGARTRLGADIAVSITGIAGPSGGSHDKPVGTVCFGIAYEHGTETLTHHYPPTSRLAIRDRAAAAALDLVRKRVREP